VLGTRAVDIDELLGMPFQCEHHAFAQIEYKAGQAKLLEDVLSCLQYPVPNVSRLQRI
jgi:hypothetical protein